MCWSTDYEKDSGVVILPDSTDTDVYCAVLKTDYSEYEYGTGYRCRHWPERWSRRAEFIGYNRKYR